MSTRLKQSTTQTVKMGPFVDESDGADEETAASPSFRVSKDGGAFAARNSGTAISHDEDGWYDVELDATDTDTLGFLIVKSQDPATYLPVWRWFEVVQANVYDSQVAGSDKLDVNTQEMNGGDLSGANAVVTLANLTINATNAPALKIQSPDDAILIDYDGTATGKSGIDFKDSGSAGGFDILFDTNVSGPIDANATQLNGNTIQQSGGYIHARDENGNALLTTTNVNVSSGVVESNVQQVLGSAVQSTSGELHVRDSDGNTFSDPLVNGDLPISVNITQVNGNTTPPERIEELYNPMPSGTIDAGTFSPTTTQFETDLGDSSDDTYIGCGIYFGNNAPSQIAGRSYLVTDSEGTTNNNNNKVKLTVQALPVTPTGAEPFILLPAVNAKTDNTNGLPSVNADAISEDTTTADNVESNIGNLDATISSRFADADKPSNFGSLAIDGSGRVTVGTIIRGALNGISDLTHAIMLMFRSDSAINTDASTTLSDINANEGSGGGDADNTADALEALRDRGDSAWVTATGFATPGDSMDISSISGDSTAADNLEADYDGTGYTKSNSTIGTVTDVTNGVTLDSSERVYWANVQFERDENAGNDTYTVLFRKDENVVAAGSVSSPTIRVYKESDGSDLVASTSLTQVSGENAFSYTEGSNTISAGETYIVEVSATIDSSTRTDSKAISRDTST